MDKTELADQFAAYSAWRKTLIDSIGDYRNWLVRQELNDAQTDLRIQQLLDRLHEDKLHVAFVAEFSRGKSELINAIFFADYGQRLLPSSAGRTTMCPTELLYDAARPSALALLPIETRETDITTSEYKRLPNEWTTIKFDVNSSESMISAFTEVSRTKRVTADEAQRYELYDPANPDDALNLNDDGTVDIPAWRYAIINFPHPLLEQGLVILDTPGLNAIGTEPELTLNMLPNAHAVLFVLAADTGVTKSESDVWRKYISGARWKQRGRLAVLNKIDGLWDELKNERAVEKEINKQIKTSAELLDLDASHIFPVSAQKGLLAKITDDDELLARSRLPELQSALSGEVVLSKKEIVRDNTESEIEDLVTNTNLLLESRRQSLADQLEELHGLRGQNTNVVEHMMSKVKEEREAFEGDLRRFQALLRVFGKHRDELFSYLGMDRLRTDVTKTRQAMVSANFTRTIRAAMDRFFEDVNERMTNSEEQSAEIKLMMDAMYKKYAKDHGISPINPPGFSTERYQRELGKLEHTYKEQFDTAVNMLVNEKMALTTKFFETVANRVVNVYEITNRDVANWLNVVMAPMESQIREQQLQLRRRLESIKRIGQATDSLEDRITELEGLNQAVSAQMNDLATLHRHIGAALGVEEQAASEKKTLVTP
ncbi:MAG: dynamin family protein [Methylobacillus sp.]|nr:dynamin family protein [Methylobacillus sp.]